MVEMFAGYEIMILQALSCIAQFAVLEIQSRTPLELQSSVLEINNLVRIIRSSCSGEIGTKVRAWDIFVGVGRSFAMRKVFNLMSSSQYDVDDLMHTH